MRTVLIAALVGLLAAVVGVKVMGPHQEAAAAKKETAFERVIKTGTLRCAYVVYEPANIKDANSGKMSGILHDVAEAIGKELGLKVEWTEEATWGTFLEPLRTGRADAFCGAGFAFAADVKNAEMVGPMYYSPITVWARADDARFDNAAEALNQPGITIVGEDGSVAANIASGQFPKAKFNSLPQNAPYSLKLDDVVAGKADATFVERAIGLDYARANPGKVKEVPMPAPLTVYANMFEVAKGEFELQSMLQGAVELLHNRGEIDRIIKVYEKEPNTFLRVQRPYRTE